MPKDRLFTEADEFLQVGCTLCTITKLFFEKHIMTAEATFLSLFFYTMSYLDVKLAHCYFVFKITSVVTSLFIPRKINGSTEGLMELIKQPIPSARGFRPCSV